MYWLAVAYMTPVHPPPTQAPELAYGCLRCSSQIKPVVEGKITPQSCTVDVLQIETVSSRSCFGLA